MKKTLAFAFLVSLLVRLWFAIGYWQPKPLTQDAQEYLELARNYIATGQFVYDDHSTTKIEFAGRAPGYPFFLATLWRITPGLAWVRIVEVILSMVSTYLFFLIARQLFDLKSAVAAFFLCSFYLPLIWLVPGILSENLWIFLILFSYLLLLKARNPVRRLPALIGSVVLLAIATLVRPASVFLIPFYFLWMKRTDTAKSAVVLVLLYFALLLPWNYYLYKKEGRFIFLASEGGITFWTGTHPQYSGEGDLAVNPPVQADYRALLSAHAGETSAERETIYRQQALHNIAAHPARYAWLELKKLVYWILPIGPSILQSSLLHRISGIGFYLPILLLAVSAFRTVKAEIRFFMLGVMISFTVMILIFFPQERFRIATIDPMLLLLASNEIADHLGWVRV